MIDKNHDHCATCDWLGREAERTAKKLDRDAWISEEGTTDSPRLHWACYQADDQ